MMPNPEAVPEGEPLPPVIIATDTFRQFLRQDGFKLLETGDPLMETWERVATPGKLYFRVHVATDFIPQAEPSVVGDQPATISADQELLLSLNNTITLTPPGQSADGPGMIEGETGDAGTITIDAAERLLSSPTPYFRPADETVGVGALAEAEPTAAVT